MTSPDDLGMLWYGMQGVTYNSTDPAEVMLNTGTTAPLLSDHPRSIIASQVTQIPASSQLAITAYGDPATIPQHNQMLYDHTSGDYISQPDYIYETYENYEEDDATLLNQSNSLVINSQNSGDISEDSNSLPKTKKPKVHHNPALKLKTPIAYQKDTDINAIPIMKEGMAVCEKCGAIGVRHAFYGKERKYCSLACARPPAPTTSSTLSKANLMEVSKYIKLNNCNEDSNAEDAKKEVKYEEGTNLNEETNVVKSGDEDKNESNFFNQEDSENSGEIESKGSQNVPIPSDYLSSLKNDQSQDSNYSNNSLAEGDSGSPNKTVQINSDKIDLTKSYEWELSYLGKEDFYAANVHSFKHAPMSECWEQINAGMKVEVSCKEESLMKDSFWVATVISIAGYKTKLRFEGFIDDNSKDFWVDLCSEEVHPVGWCATQGKPLIPPKSIQNKYKDWKEFLMRRLTGARTLPTNFHARAIESQKSRFRPGQNLEVVDKNRIAQMRVATVTEIIGKRLHLRYHGAPPDDNGFWCHEDSAIIHPVGWSREVGHEIVASQSYHEKCMDVSYDPEDAAPDLFFTHNKFALKQNQGFFEGMKLEAIDPLNLATICVATIMKVLSHNYLMIRIDSYDSDDTNSDWFCYHASSPCILPAGFCEMNNITLTPPRGYEGEFSWYEYISKTGATAAPPILFDKDIPNHGFNIGMALEAVDLMDPRLVCIASIKDVKGRLLKIHFDGWESDFDQWVDCHSPDIYPVGWCKMVGYILEGPRITAPISFAPKRRGRGRGSGRRGRGYGRGRVSRITENEVPLSCLNSNFARARRGRRPLKGSSGIFKTDLSNRTNFDLNKEDLKIHRGRRGRPPKNLLKISNHQSVEIPQQYPLSRNNHSSYLHSDDEVSDETSSGVASLADSETSADFWDIEVNNAPTGGNVQNKIPEFNDVVTESSHQIQGSNCKDSYALTPLSESVFSYDEASSLATFLNSAEVKTVNPSNLCAEDSSSINTPADNFIYAEENSNNNCGGPGYFADVSSNTSASSLLNHQCQNEQEQHFQEGNSVPSSLGGVSTHSSSVNTKEYLIPRIIDNSHVFKGEKLQPKLWSQHHVCTFLQVNDCGSYCQNFMSKKIDGSKFLRLSQNDVLELTGMKVGPSLKIHDLIQQLLAIVNPAQARYQATLLKRGMAFGKS